MKTPIQLLQNLRIIPQPESLCVSIDSFQIGEPLTFNQTVITPTEYKSITTLDIRIDVVEIMKETPRLAWTIKESL